MPDKEFFDFEDYSLDLGDGSLKRNGEPVHLTPITTRILQRLVKEPGSVVTKEELKRAGWSQNSVADGAFYQKIAELYKTLGKSGSGAEYIENVPARGYRFAVPFTLRTIAAPERPQEIEDGIPDSPPGNEGGGNRAHSRRRVAAGTVLALMGICSAAYAGFELHEDLSGPRIEGYRRLTHNGLEKAGPLLRDGSRLYFEQGAGPDRKVAYCPAEGSGVVPLNPPISDGVLDLDAVNLRTGELLLLGKSGAWLWMPGITWARRLGIEGVQHGGFSQDGRIVAVSRKDTNAVELYPADLSTRTPVFSLPPHSTQWFPISFSPSGGVVRFSVFDLTNERSSIWEASVDGHAARALFPTSRSGAGAATNACCGVWTADGRWFVFSLTASEQNVDRASLRVVREARSWLTWLDRPEPVALKSPISFSWPAIGADGKTIFAIGSEQSVRAVRLDLRTREFSPFLNGATARDLSPSNDGSWVAYTDDADQTIWKSRPDGSSAAQLTFRPMEAYQPHWSPDGKTVAFMGRMPGHLWRAYLISSLGGQPEAAYEDNNEQGVPTWSAGGRYLIFGDRHDQRPDSQMTIHRWDFQTRRLSGLPGSAGLWSARCSPDGRYIAAQSADWNRLYLFDTRLQTWERLGAWENTDDLNWSPDGAYLYFMGVPPSSHARSCYRIRLADRQVDEILRREDHPELGVHLVGVAGGGSPVFNRLIANEEIYALDVKWP